MLHWPLDEGLQAGARARAGEGARGGGRTGAVVVAAAGAGVACHRERIDFC